MAEQEIERPTAVSSTKKAGSEDKLTTNLTIEDISSSSSDDSSDSDDDNDTNKLRLAGASDHTLDFSKSIKEANRIDFKIITV